MKGEDCKVPIREEQRTFLNNQKNAHFSGSKKVGIIAAFLLLIAMSLMIVFTFQSINGINELRQEVDYLKGSFQLLQHQINADRNRDSPKITTSSPNVIKDDYIDEDDNYDYDYDTDGDYNSSYENENDGTEYDDIPNNTGPLTGEKYTKDAKKATAPPRTKRDIVGYSQDGIDGRRRNITYIKNYYSTPPPPSSYLNPLYIEDRTRRNLDNITPAPRQIHTTRVRVYHDRAPLKSGDSQAAENPNEEFTALNDDHLTRGRTRHRQKRLEFEEGHARTGRMRPLPTAHFSGDTSKYVLGQHDNFNGNGHLRHPQRTFVDWAESSWFHALGMDRHFSLTDGILTMKESGLYFIYAQIYYLDEHDINGFRVYRNENETLLQCTTMTHSVDRVMKGNTCFTAAAEYLNENDRISLGDLSESRYSLFEPGKSFFGVIKLGDVKIK